MGPNEEKRHASCKEEEGRRQEESGRQEEGCAKEGREKDGFKEAPRQKGRGEEVDYHHKLIATTAIL